ncbi:hypothetical protein L208DRAFT_1111393, partial [Tricholoma matsutake]
ECTCRVTVEQQEIAAGHGVIHCKRPGCETKWYHLSCVGLEYLAGSWICKACGS